MLSQNITAEKVSKCGVFSGTYFPVFRLNTEIYAIQSEYTDQKKLRIWTLFTQCIHKINIEIKHQNRPRKPDKNRLLMAKLSKVTRSGMEAIVYSVFGNMLTLCCY